MYLNKRVLAVIPARGGSKRLPNKNVMPFAGKPLLAWSIEAALQSRFIDTVIVSSDNLEILEVAERFGAETQQRPDYLATDTASTVDCVSYVVEKLVEQFDILVLLQPTSPLRTSKDIDLVVESLANSAVAGVVSVTETEHSPLWANTLPDDKSLAHFIRPEVQGKRSQDLPAYYRLNGAVYAVTLVSFIQQTSFIPDESIAHVMPNSRSMDIDTHADFICAEALYKHMAQVGEGE